MSKRKPMFLDETVRDHALLHAEAEAAGKPDATVTALREALLMAEGYVGQAVADEINAVLADTAPAATQEVERIEAPWRAWVEDAALRIHNSKGHTNHYFEHCYEKVCVDARALLLTEGSGEWEDSHHDARYLDEDVTTYDPLKGHPTGVIRVHRAEGSGE